MHPAQRQDMAATALQGQLLQWKREGVVPAQKKHACQSPYRRAERNLPELVLQPQHPPEPSPAEHAQGEHLPIPALEKAIFLPPAPELDGAPRGNHPSTGNQGLGRA